MHRNKNVDIELIYFYFQTEKVIYIATEPVTPLETYLRESSSEGAQNELAISWGLHQILVCGTLYLIGKCQQQILNIEFLFLEIIMDTTYKCLMMKKTRSFRKILKLTVLIIIMV
jgi:hypothetical protein